MNAYSWTSIRDRVEGHGAEWRPMLRLLDWIREEKLEGEIFGHISMFDVIFTDCPRYRNGENTLHVSWNPQEKKMRFCYDRIYASTDPTVKEVSEEDSIETLRQFLAYKLGVYRKKESNQRTTDNSGADCGRSAKNV